jgi:hypothetical protein
VQQILNSTASARQRKSQNAQDMKESNVSKNEGKISKSKAAKEGKKS